LSNGEQWINTNKQNVIFKCPQFNLLRFHYKTDTSTNLLGKIRFKYCTINPN
jgi:hypothetical protein